MKLQFLIAAMTIIFSQVSHAQLNLNSSLNASAVYLDGTSVPVNCSNGVVNVTNINYITFNFQEPYGTHPLGCIKGAANASSLVSECKDLNDVKPISGPAGWQEFTNSAGYLWTQNYPASKLPTNYAIKLAMKMAIVPATTIYYCQFTTTGSSNAVVSTAPAAPAPSSTVTGVYPYDCPVQFSPLPPVGTPCASLVPSGNFNLFPNATEYAQQHGINQTQTRASCAAGEPKGHPLCWTDTEAATYINCIGTYDDSPERTVIFGGLVNINIGVLINGVPAYMVYRQNNPKICAYYVPSPVTQQSIQPVMTPATPAPVAAPVTTPTPAPVVTKFHPRRLGRIVR